MLAENSHAVASFLKVLLICHKFVFQVKAPWLKHFVYTGDDYTCYIIPGLVGIVDGQLGISNHHDYEF